MMKACAAPLLLGLVALAGFSPAAADSPRIAIVIDDLGDRLAAGERAVRLPAGVTCAFLPHTPHAAALAEQAHARGKEVILHQPMQAVEALPLGPGGVFLDMTERRFRETVRRNLRSIPHAVGVNNHMGSLLTRHPGHMTWLMTLLREDGVGYFLDSRTTAASVAERMAREQGVPTLRRHVFLDNDRDIEAIRAQFRRLVELARRQGYAVGIGHPYPGTLTVLEQELPRLAGQGVTLVPLSALMSTVGQERDAPRQAVSSH